MSEKEFAVILKIDSYDGKDTYLEVGGEYLKGKETMYASIYFPSGKKVGVADYGYRTAKQARDVIKTLHPNAVILEAV